ncbi:MAG: tetratricopeptide repeat protein [Candidatus Omnitrophota bacterium]|jgi:Tfp pilus assembly protein PilF
MLPKLKRRVSLFLCCLSIALCSSTSVFALDKRLSLTLTHYIMASMHEQSGDTEEAVSEYKKALDLDPRNALIHLNLALCYLRQNDASKATLELNLAIKYDEEAIEPHAVLALLYFSQGKPDLATVEYEIALKNASKIEPKNIDVYKSLGIVYLRQKKFKDAQNTYRLILDLSPADSEAHFYMANIYDELKNRDETITELKKAIELRPDYAEALNYLGYLYIEENKNFDIAEGLIRKALTLEPENGAYIDSLGWLYFKQGKFIDAVQELKKASTLLEDHVIYDHLGDAYLKLQDRQNAKTSWEKSLIIDSKQEQIKQKLDKLNQEITKNGSAPVVQ